MMVLVLPLEEAGDNGIKLLVLGEAASASASAWLLPPALHRCLPCYHFQFAQPENIQFFIHLNKYDINCEILQSFRISNQRW